MWHCVTSNLNTLKIHHGLNTVSILINGWQNSCWLQSTELDWKALNSRFFFFLWWVRLHSSSPCPEILWLGRYGQSNHWWRLRQKNPTAFNATTQTVILLNSNWGSTLNVTASSQTWLSEEESQMTDTCYHKMPSSPNRSECSPLALKPWAFIWTTFRRLN